MASTAGELVAGSRVRVGPPLGASGRSRGSTPDWSPVEAKPHDPTASMLYPSEVTGPEQVAVVPAPWSTEPATVIVPPPEPTAAEPIVLRAIAALVGPFGTVLPSCGRAPTATPLPSTVLSSTRSDPPIISMPAPLWSITLRRTTRSTDVGRKGSMLETPATPAALLVLPVTLVSVRTASAPLEVDAALVAGDLDVIEGYRTRALDGVVDVGGERHVAEGRGAGRTHRDAVAVARRGRAEEDQRTRRHVVPGPADGVPHRHPRDADRPAVDLDPGVGVGRVDDRRAGVGVDADVLARGDPQGLERRGVLGAGHAQRVRAAGDADVDPVGEVAASSRAARKEQFRSPTVTSQTPSPGTASAPSVLTDTTSLRTGCGVQADRASPPSVTAPAATSHLTSRCLSTENPQFSRGSRRT